MLPIPIEHEDIIESKNELPKDYILAQLNINALFNTGYLQAENGYRHNRGGSVYAAVLTQMPSVTIDMID